MRKLQTFSQRTMVDILKADPDYVDNFMVRSVYNSAAIEGNTLSQGETEVLLIDGFVPNFKRPVSLRELHEVSNLRTCWEYTLSNCYKQITVTILNRLHRIIMRSIDEEGGLFKKTQNIVGSRLTTSPSNTPLEMQYLISNLVDGRLAYAKSDEDIVEAVAWSHLEFEKIHPYADGNGRTGRALMNFILLGENLPPIVVEVQEKAEYLDYLRTDDVKGLAEFVRKRIDIEKELLNRNGPIVP